MAQLWGGRFTKETDQLVYNFNASISFDQKFYRQDIKGSIAHATMLGKTGIITPEESDQIVKELNAILEEVENTLLNDDNLRYRKILVIAGKGWHQGVIGIVAARIKDRYGKPVIIITYDDRQNSIFQGKAIILVKI